MAAAAAASVASSSVASAPAADSRARTAAAARGSNKSADVRIDKVLFLGTSAAVPVPGKRNMSSLAVLLTSGEAVLVDCGEGTQHHIRVSSVLRASRISVVLLTHLHGDHCFGLFGLLQTVATEGRKAPLLLIGPEGMRTMVETVLNCSGGWRPEETFELIFMEIPNCGEPGREDLVGSEGSGGHGQGFNAERCARAAPVPLGVQAGLSLQAVPMVHSLPDWGYVLTEPDRPGTLDAARAVELGVPARSPLLGQLKRGQAVQLPDGSTVTPEQVVGPSRRGRTLAVLQDTSDAVAALGACAGAACVVHEATFEAAMEQEAIAKGHSTSAMAARFAATCGARRLVLTHFSARYSNSSDAAVSAQHEDPAEALGDEARKILGNGTPVVVAKDFLVLRGDRDFEPELQLATKRPWCATVEGSNGSAAPCCA